MPILCFISVDSFQDPLTGKTSKVKVVIQLFIKPGSCQVGPPTVGAVSEIDPNISNQELEWSIIEPDSVLLYGILIKVDKGPDEAGYKGFIDKVLKGNLRLLIFLALIKYSEIPRTLTPLQRSTRYNE